MLKKILPYLLLSIVYFLLSKQVYASDPNFEISVNSNYNIATSGMTTLTQNIQIKNKTEYYYTPSYSVSIGFKDLENVIAYGQDGSIPFTEDSGPDNTKTIKLTFPKRVTGLGNTNNFTLKFDTKDIASKQGSVWEVSIPGIANPEDFTAYNSTITVPDSFGFARIIKPEKKVGNSRTISFIKDEIGKAGIFLIYGEKQYYSFTLRYNISNPNLFPVKTEIALPPQTNYQNVDITSMSEKPLNVTLDHDQNWLAEYSLLPQERKTITVTGMVEILAQPEESPMSDTQLSVYTQPRKYWESTDPSIQRVSSQLRTPQDIYNYVVKTLTYNFNKVSTDNVRLGAVGALKTPQNSVCLEFTDLFVALARAVGIPARSVEGYAYTTNDKLRPLSLVEDVLHAWPEYYDKQKKEWIMVDPTWGNTTKGMDYFNELDFEHIAFVVKGYDSEYPIPAGGYKFTADSKDVDVKFATAGAFQPTQIISINDTFPNYSFPGLSLDGDFLVHNKGNSPVSNLTANVVGPDGTRQFFIDYIPPYGYKRISLRYDKIPFLTNGLYPITIHVGNTTYSKSVRISLIPDLTTLLIIGGIISGAIIISTASYYTGSLLIQRRQRQNNLRGKGKRP